MFKPVAPAQEAARSMPTRTPWAAASRAPEIGIRSLGPVLTYHQDRQIYGEGAEAGTIYKVVTGAVRTCKFLADGRRLVDAFHVAGDVFGVEAGSEYSFSAEAVCDTSLIAYRRRGIEASAAMDAVVSQQLFSYAMHSLIRAQMHVLLLGRRSAVEKVAAFLIEWATHSGDADSVTLEMGRQDIADYLGLTIETVSRTLTLFERNAFIAFSSLRRIRLTDPMGLRGLVS
jgi:CRP/FNR family nitrogen fixation transcriptional regulator